MGLTQKELILNYMQKFGGITQLDALREFGCMRLASRITDLKKDGHLIMTITKTTKRKYDGKTVHYAEYRLIGGKHD